MDSVNRPVSPQGAAELHLPGASEERETQNLLPKRIPADNEKECQSKPPPETRLEHRQLSETETIASENIQPPAFPLAEPSEEEKKKFFDYHRSLVTTVIRTLAIARKNSPVANFPIISGNCAYTCNSIIEKSLPYQPVEITPECLSNHNEITVIAAAGKSPQDPVINVLDSLFRNLLNRERTEDKALSARIDTDTAGLAIYSYQWKGYPILNIRILVYPPAAAQMLQPRELGFKAPDTRNPIPLFSASEALPCYVQSLIYGPLSSETIYWAAEELRQLEPETEADVMQWNSASNLYNSYCDLGYCARPVPAVTVTPEFSGLVPTKLLQPVSYTSRQASSCPEDQKTIRKPEPVSTSRVLTGSTHFRDKIRYLKRGTDAHLDLGYDHIRDLMAIENRQRSSQSSSGSLSPSPVHGSPSPGPREKPRAKRKNHHKQTKQFRKEAAKGGIPIGMLLEQKELTASGVIDALSEKIRRQTDCSSKVETLFASNDIARTFETANNIEDRETARVISHPFPQCPYLGKARCDYVSRPAHKSERSYQKSAEDIYRLLNEIFSHQNIAGALPCERAQKIHGAIAAWLLKYICYMEKKNNSLASLLHSFSHYLLYYARQAASPVGQYDPEVWYILPQTLVVLLSSPEVRACSVPEQTQLELMKLLSTLLLAAQNRGLYNLASAIISLVGNHCRDWSISRENFAATGLVEQVNAFLQTLGVLLNERYDGSAEQVNAAKISLELISDIKKMPGHWCETISSSGYVTAVENSANKILERDESATRKIKQELDSEREALKQQKQQLKQKYMQARITASRKNRPLKEEATGDDESDGDSAEELSAIFTLQTAPLSSTASAAVHHRKEPWEEDLARCVSQCQNPGKRKEAKRLRDDALKKTGASINHARIWTEFGEARLGFPYMDTILKAGIVAKTCHNCLVQMNNVVPLTQQYFRPQSEKDQRLHAKHWLNENDMPEPGALKKVMEEFPENRDLSAAASALDEAIDCYQKAIELMEKCTPDEFHTHGQFMLEIMERDLGKTLERRSHILSAKTNMDQALKVRRDIMKAVGLYGRPHPFFDAPSSFDVLTTERGQRSGQASKGSSTAASPGPAPRAPHKSKTAYAEEKFRASSVNFSVLFPKAGGTDKMDTLFASLRQLRQDMAKKYNQ